MRPNSVTEINDILNEKKTIHSELGISLEKEVFYDHVLWTMAAGVESKLKNYTKELEWDEVNLRPYGHLQRHNYYKKNVKGYIRKSLKSDTLFIIKSSSYSTWGSKTWVGKTAYLLKKIYNPNILAFPGFLTAEYLKSSPLYPDLKGDAMATDIYYRIVKYVNEVNKQRKRPIKNIGLIGFSGGGAEIISLLNIDGNRKFFNMGGIAFSPVLSEKVVFDNLDMFADELVKENGKKPVSSAGFTTFGNRFTLAFVLSLFEAEIEKPFKINFGVALLKDPKKSILIKEEADIISEKEKKLKTIFFNEFVVVDLKGTIDGFNNNRVESVEYLQKTFKWIDTRKESKYSFLNPSGNRHKDFWFNYALESKQLYTNNSKLTLEELVDPISKFKRISSNLYVVFSQDDPVLSNRNFYNEESDKLGLLPIEISKLIDYNRKDNIKFFTPKAGGHMGYFLDTNWLEKTIKTFFTKID